ncbi:MAG: hypothetical protein U1C70_08340 [Sediminibacterium sp.]|jgi:hypothetical protein|uniref:hypothetical protein n=1 Tax=Sediminibacterium sp. TaxID=1917865 RepID=UPI002AB9B3A2|nr:hypothetical protein [Sediminibacterium sp.]MDZ4071817.1 hypothetical protein [Sediminibacterium sp.]
MDILASLKSEYARALILIVIPGAISLAPFYLLCQDDITLLFKGKTSEIYQSVIYLLLSFSLGHVVTDLGARYETILDRRYCKKKKINYDIFLNRFNLYLFNKKQEDLIATHYYRSMLLRLQFELHHIVAICLLLIGMLLRLIFVENFIIDWQKTIVFLVIALSLLLYLRYEAIKGVETLDYFRLNINRKIGETFTLLDLEVKT